MSERHLRQALLESGIEVVDNEEGVVLQYEVTLQGSGPTAFAALLSLFDAYVELNGALTLLWQKVQPERPAE